MTTTNRVSALIQSLGLTKGRPSRSSLQRSSSRGAERITNELSPSPTVDGKEPTEKTRESQLDAMVAPEASPSLEKATGVAEAVSITQISSPAEASLATGTKQDEDIATQYKSAPGDLSENVSAQSNQSTANTDSSFASPFMPAMTDDGLHPGFNSLVSEEARIGRAVPVRIHSGARVRAALLPNSPSAMSALRSHPPDQSAIPSRAATVPGRRLTSFGPTPLDTHHIRHWSSGDVLGTPYPQEGHTKLTPPALRTDQSGSRARTQREEVDHRSNPRPRISTPRSNQRESSGSRRTASRKSQRPKEEDLCVAVSDAATGNSRSVTLFIPNEGPGAGASGRDDEEFAYRMRDAYLALRGPWKSLFLARSVIGAHLHPVDGGPSIRTSHDPNGMAFRARQGQSAQVSSSLDSHASNRSGALCGSLLDLFHDPGRGQGATEIMDHIHRIVREDPTATIRLVEGWSVPRISIACAFVLIASIVGTLLWIFIGVGERAFFELVNTTAAAGVRPLRIVSETGRALPSLPGDRLEPAAALGGLILFMGWSITGAWMFLSYLVG